MIKKENLEKGSHDFEQIKTVSIYLDDGRVFTIKRDFLRMAAECGDHDEFDFDTYSTIINKDCKFTEEEKEDIMNLYYNDEFDEWLEW